MFICNILVLGETIYAYSVNDDEKQCEVIIKMKRKTRFWIILLIALLILAGINIFYFIKNVLFAKADSLIVSPAIEYVDSVPKYVSKKIQNSSDYYYLIIYFDIDNDNDIEYYRRRTFVNLKSKDGGFEIAYVDHSEPESYCQTIIPNGVTRDHVNIVLFAKDKSIDEIEKFILQNVDIRVIGRIRNLR